MGHRDHDRLTGAVPEYVQRPTPVLLVNPDGSPQVPLEIPRRRDDTDDSGVQQRRNTGQAVVEPDDHWWRCWGHRDGPGALFRAEVTGKLDALTKRSWYQAGGAAVVGLIAMAFLASWLSGKFAATERSAVKREDVVAAVQQSANMAVAKQADDFMLLRKQLEQAAVDVSLPAAARARK